MSLSCICAEIQGGGFEAAGVRGVCETIRAIATGRDSQPVLSLVGGLGDGGGGMEDRREMDLPPTLYSE